MRALVKQAVLLEESGAVRPELCRRFLSAYSAQAGGERPRSERPVRQAMC